MNIYKSALSEIVEKYTKLAQKNIKPSMKDRFFLAARGKGDDSCYKAQWEHGVMAELEKTAPRMN